jgi:hypothetical protein
MMYLQRRRKVFLFIIFQVKLLMIHMHRDITSNVSSSILLIASFSKILITCLGISKCSRPTTHFSFSVKLGPVYGLKIRLISQIQSSSQYLLPGTVIMFGRIDRYLAFRDIKLRDLDMNV